ncbi:MAG: hypothetical protein IPG45_09520 [Deltaproteobacteria bacterium]|nr:hypothetical protein [Deltaproteobacteria bacterium]
MRAPYLFALTFTLASPGIAQAAPDFFGREGYYDLSGAPEIKDLRLDYEYLRTGRPTSAETLGLVGAATVQTRRNFVYIEDTDGTLTIPFRSSNDLQTAFNFALRELYQVHPDEFVFVYLFTSFDPRVGAFFYAPEANETRGIGSPRYDQNGPSPREGFVFMNYWQSMQQMYGQFGAAVVRAQGRSIFNQEAGHRWASFIELGTGNNGSGTDLLLGRDEGHWSYFMNSGGSPMEGNAWFDNGNGTFTTTTNLQNWRFSQLDLYLMGLLPKEMVEPFFVIQNPVVQGGGRDLYGQVPTRSSPPQIIEPVTVSGTRTNFTIDNVISRNANRAPAFGAAPNTWRVVFVMLASRTAPLSEPDRTTFEGMVDNYAAGFHEGTGNRGTLDYSLIEDPVPLPIGGECTDNSNCQQTPDPLFCLPRSGGAPGLCTKPCADASSCPGDWCCADLSGTGSLACLPKTEFGDGQCPVISQPQPDAGVSDDAGPSECSCNTGEGCQEGCACDPACAMVPAPTPNLCACDLSYSCDPAANGEGNCACDPECDEGCGCTTTQQNSASVLGLAGAFGLLLLRRRRR